MRTRQVVVHEYGSPAVLNIENHEVSEPKSNQVTIHNQYISVDYTDIYWRTGQLDAPKPPLTPGKAGAGVIVKVGAKVKDLKIGDRVAYIQAPGAYSEYFNAPARLVVKLPDSISFKAAAAMMMKGLTANALVKRVYPVSVNKTVFIHAMAGGLGSFITAWSKILGATVIGTVGDDKKAQYAKSLGADKVINYHHDDVLPTVMNFTKNTGVNVVYDGIGQATVNESLKMLGPQGMYVNFGQVSGPVNDFSLGILAEKTQYATFANVNTFVDDLSLLQAMSDELFTFYQETAFAKNQTITEFSFDEVIAAHQLLESGQSHGSIVMKV